MDRAHRLTSSREFRRVLMNGRRGSAGSVACSVLQNEGPASVRVGVSVGKRVGNAVARNRAKRMLREVARARLDSFSPGSDVVIAARPGILTRTFQELESELARAIEKVGA